MNGNYVRSGWLAVAIGAIAAGDASHVAAAEKSWNAGSDSWSTPANWTPAGVPASGDVIRIGNLPGVTSSTVFLDLNKTLGGLHITNRMALQNEGHTVIVNGETTVSGDASRLNISDAVIGSDFRTETMTVAADANVYLVGGDVRINDQLTLVGGEIGGLFNETSTVAIWGTGTTLHNGGRISSGPGTVTFLQNNDGLYDLDGPNGDGELHVSGTNEAKLVFLGGEISDSFSGKISLGPYARLAMNFGAWTADENSLIDVYGGFGWLGGDDRAEIMGGTATFAGALDVSGSATELVVSAPAVVAPTATVNVGLGDRLVFAGETRVDGGMFNTNGFDAAAGEVNFDGPTEWSGTVTINGRAQQNGAATVTAPTVINAGMFDWGGAASDVVSDVEAPLTINAVTTMSALVDPFSGVMNIGGGALSRVTLNLAGESHRLPGGWKANSTYRAIAPCSCGGSTARRCSPAARSTSRSGSKSAPT